jgi:Recombination endonuclease VII
VTATLWVPRPPHPDEPACWSWPIPPLVSVDDGVARAIAEQRKRLRPEDESIRELLEDVLRSTWKWSGADGMQFSAFHDGRCAACGLRPSDGRLIEDHCHRTGQTRGYLDHGCNVSEGRSRQPLFERYRRVHPAAIFDYHRLYDGRGWILGWSWSENPSEAARAERTCVERPATPWPTWTPETLEVTPHVA